VVVAETVGGGGRALQSRSSFALAGTGLRAHGREERESLPMQRTGREQIMASEELNAQLVKHIDDAYAMEQNILHMLDGMIETAEDAEIKQELEHHKSETEQHAERMRRCLEAHDASPSKVKEAEGILGSFMKGVVDMARSDKAARNARDGFATEHVEIASYELLERVARRAGDEATAEAARLNRKDEEAMAQKISARWDKYADLSLREAGVAVQG
jgi:ferritin-like metal-binding protein YciE